MALSVGGLGNREVPLKALLPFRSFWAGGAFKGTSSRGGWRFSNLLRQSLRSFFEGPPTRSTLKEVIHQSRSRAAPRFTNKTALSVVITRLASTGSAFHLSQGSPLEAACFSRSHCGPILPRRRLRKIFPPTAQPLFTEMLFLCAVRRPLFGDTP